MGCQQVALGLCLQAMQRRVSINLTALAVLVPLLDMAALGTAAGTAVAQTTTTYRWVDAQGVVHYSDTPQPGAQVIQLAPAQTYRAPPTPPAPAAASKAATANPSGSPYQSCGVVEPAAESSIFAPESVPVAVQLTPNLRPGDQIAVTVDGVALQPVSPGRLEFQISAPERGAHTVNTDVRDGEGTVVCHAASTFYVQRPSLNSPQSPARGH
jgi:hypothetical protein